MMTLQNPPPQLEQRVGQRNFSKWVSLRVVLCHVVSCHGPGSWARSVVANAQCSLAPHRGERWLLVAYPVTQQALKMPLLISTITSLIRPFPTLLAFYPARPPLHAPAPRSMREVVSLCLQKDPAKRPSARQLLEHRFFRQARDKAYLAKHLLAGGL